MRPINRERFEKVLNEHMFKLVQILTNPNVSLMGREFAVRQAKVEILEEFDINTGLVNTIDEEIKDLIPEEFHYTMGGKKKKKK
jgi:hypothetical protein